MIPEHLIIEEKKKRERRQQWQPVPLYAPAPSRRPEPNTPHREKRENTGGNVIIIDISDYSTH